MNTRACLSDTDLGRLWTGDVEPGDRTAFEEHLKACADCKARWDRMTAGAEYALSVFREAVSEVRVDCPSDDILAGYAADSLTPRERGLVTDHLAECRRCVSRMARFLEEAYAREGDAAWTEYVGRQVLGLLARVPEAAEDLAKAVGTESARAVRSQEVIRLPFLEPTEPGQLRLAAATGDGVAEQVLRQEEPPFEFHLMRFGRQLRITVRPAEDASPYADCLARLEIAEGDQARSSRVILIVKGEGQCVIEPEEAEGLRPEKGHLSVRLVPLATPDDLSAAGTEAYLPILQRLLGHEDPSIRRHAVDVIARIRGPAAERLIRPLAHDPDEMVQVAVRKALRYTEGP